MDASLLSGLLAERLVVAAGRDAEHVGRGGGDATRVRAGPAPPHAAQRRSEAVTLQRCVRRGASVGSERGGGQCGHRAWLAPLSPTCGMARCPPECLVPVVLGAGSPLWKPGSERRLRLLEARPLATGGVILRYVPATT